MRKELAEKLPCESLGLMPRRRGKSAGDGGEESEGKETFFSQSVLPAICFSFFFFYTATPSASNSPAPSKEYMAAADADACDTQAPPAAAGRGARDSRLR